MIEYYEALDAYGKNKQIEPFKNFILPIIEKRLEECNLHSFLTIKALKVITSRLTK